MSIVTRINEHIEFHESLIKTLDEKGVFKKQHDSHKSDAAFLGAIKSHINELYAKIGELEIKLGSTILDTK